VPTTAASFSPDLFAFLSELREHNDREWFAANKARYEDELVEPARDFVEAFGPLLYEISPHFRADPRRVGGSLFRIYRDTRFSKDKTPYKTNLGLFFRHERAKEVPAPGFYLHVGPGECFCGAGIYHPERATSNRIRAAIAADPDGWRAARGSRELVGSALKRPPAGFDRDHPLIEDLKRKDFACVARLPDAAVTAPGFVEDYAQRCREALPLVRFLCGALDVPC
jgi:uncharacterized protein (TIGR02453 family)